MWALPLALVWCVLSATADVEAPLRCRDPRCRYKGMLQFDEHRYIVDGNELSVLYSKTDGFLRLNCFGANAFESAAMPRADATLTAWGVVIAKCQLPAAGSILDRLAWLNVTMLFNDTEEIRKRGKLTIDRLPPPSLLTAKHFSGLENLVSLDIHTFEDDQVTAEINFLAPLKSLSTLRIQHVKLPDGELDALRSTLQKLVLIQTGVKRLPEAVYTSSSLLSLNVESDMALDAVTIPPKLQSLDLMSPATTLQVESAPALEKLSLTHWTETRPPPLTSCDNLSKIYLTAPAVQTLPHRWLATCWNLDELVIEDALNLSTLPKRLFGRTSALSLVALKEGALESLNEGQFDEDAGKSELEQLQLNGNHLRNIPNDTLPLSLSKLDLSSNDLDSGVLDMVGAVEYYLSHLNLASNPRLGDACDEDGYSPLRPVNMLKKLSLQNTNVSRVCRDWRENMPQLQELDLRDSAVSTLTFEDLQFTRTVPAKVLLEGAPVTLLEMTSDDLEKAMRTPSSGAFVLLGADTRLHCDCRMYWTRRVLERSPHALDRVSELRCRNGQLLKELMAEELVCPRPEQCAAAALPAACTCSQRPQDEPARGGQLLRVNCTRAALARVPRLPRSENRRYELILANNHIADVHAADLRDVMTIDLRNNFIKRVDKETASLLGDIGGSLRLAGNPLECDCSAISLLQALHSRAPRHSDLGDISCSDGTALEHAPVVECQPSVAGYVAGLAALFVLAVAALTYFSSRERRFFAKAVLVRWGCRCWLDADDDDRRYDAFVTYSHKDEDVVRELMSRLEPPYRLCVHRRDWVPGLRIPEQIVASVRESRRTVALVSRHFLASTWTRAEFREAHEAAMAEATPRLLVVLLEEPAALALDDQLQRYIATHTYLRWGEPWFYHKLAVALPRPRRPQAIIESAPFGSSASRACIISKPEKRSPTQDQHLATMPIKLSTMSKS